MEYPSAERVALKVIAELESTDAPTVVLGIGMPGSGKSTIMRMVNRQLPARSYIVETDELRRRAVRLQTPGKNIFSFMRSEMMKHVTIATDRGKHVLLDGTNVEYNQRELDVTYFKKLGNITVGGLFMSTGLDAAHQRNSERNVRVMPWCIDEMNSELHKSLPTIHEGYHWLMTVDANGVTVDRPQ